MKYISHNISLCVKLSKVKDSDFSMYREKASNILMNFPNVKNIIQNATYLSDNKSGVLYELSFILDYIKMFFMIDIIAYQNIANVLEKIKIYYLIFMI